MVMIPGGGKRVGDMPSGGGVVPEATYHIRADKSDLKKAGAQAKNAGAPMAAVMFTIFGPAEQEEHHGRKLFENFILVGEGLWRSRQYFEASGEGPDFVIEDTEQFMNREVAAVVGLEPEQKVAPEVIDANHPTGFKHYPAKNVIKKFLPIAG